jgi:outer membrane protein assembly factor BamA
MKHIFFFIIIILISYNESFSQEKIFIKDIEIIRNNVADEENPNISFLGSLMNALHITTKNYVVEQELLFGKDEEIDADLIDESERNLRAMGIFTKVKIELDSLGFDEYKAKVHTTDNWSSMFVPVYNFGGGFANYGADLDEFNFLGTATHLKLKGVYRNESKIGWEGTFVLFNSRIPYTDLQDSISIISNRLRTNQQFILQIPYRTNSSQYSIGAKFFNTFGKDFLYRNTYDYELIDNTNKLFELWYSHAWWEKDRLYMTFLSGYDKATRHSQQYRQAFDNSGYLLLNFASISQSFDVVNKINGFPDEDLIYGGWGSATLGKIFPLNSDGDNLYYIAGSAEKSFYNQQSYLFIRVEGASGFDKVVAPHYTYQESLITYFHNFSNGFLITGRFSQQSVWNWNAWRQLILDNDNGLRGVELNQLQGENRMFLNTELRYFLDKIEILQFKFSLAAFFDIGSVWNQDMKLYNSKFYKSAGLGIRFHFVKSNNPVHLFRLDFPYNFGTKQFSVVLTTKQMFSSFTNHLFTLPQLLGKLFDYD